MFLGETREGGTLQHKPIYQCVCCFSSLPLKCAVNGALPWQPSFINNTQRPLPTLCPALCFFSLSVVSSSWNWIRFSAIFWKKWAKLYVSSTEPDCKSDPTVAVYCWPGFALWLMWNVRGKAVVRTDAAYFQDFYWTQQCFYELQEERVLYLLSLQWTLIHKLMLKTDKQPEEFQF